MIETFKNYIQITLQCSKRVWVLVTYFIEKNIDGKANHAIKHKINFTHKTELLNKVENEKILKKTEKETIIQLIDSGTDFRTHRKPVMALMLQHPSPKICNKLIDSNFFRPKEIQVVPKGKHNKKKHESKCLMEKAWQFNEIAQVCAFFNNEVGNYFKYRSTDEEQTRSSKQFIYEKNLIKTYDKLFPYINRAFKEDTLCDGKGYSPLGKDCAYCIDFKAKEVVKEAANDFKDQIKTNNI